MDERVESLINGMHNIRMLKSELNERLKELNSDWSEKEAELIAFLKDENLTKIATGVASASLSISTYFSVKDKESFYKWVVENGKFELTQSRISNAPAVEMLENEGTIPEGTDTYLKEKINLRGVRK
jgi:hypothetical protein